MNPHRFARRLIAIASCIVATSTGCAFQGVNSLPLPGAVGRGDGSTIYHAQFANIGALQANSPVLLDDVIVGSVVKMTFRNWRIDVEVSVKPDTVVPANAAATIGQTSLLGSMHVALDPPVGQPPVGRLPAGATLAPDATSTYPSTEQTLSSVSAVVNGGSLGQVGDIIHNFNAALSGREGEWRSLLTRLDTLVGTLDAQRENIVASITALDRLAGTVATQRDVIVQAMDRIPPALDVLIKERPRITTALEKLDTFSDTATRLVNSTQADLVANLQNLEPTLRALADVGPRITQALALATAYPYGQDVIDRGVRGDYINAFIVADPTVPRLKRTLFLGTRWGEEGAALVPAPGDPYYLNHTTSPLEAGTALPPAATPVPDAVPPAPDGMPPMPPVTTPLLPVTPPLFSAKPESPTPETPPTIFAGPYGAEGLPATTATPGGGG